ncbi:MAG TPA: hypothetical protein PK668_17520 [Myxococcota bacterium]|nr:hypothetical protein [Myxococcota bacterium]HRY94961.1 hypothetical protein [Myxococcota bacterium]HSA19976.1 hypothetical protein [Myxococcota bacterium]
MRALLLAGAAAVLLVGGLVAFMLFDSSSGPGGLPEPGPDGDAAAPAPPPRERGPRPPARPVGLDAGQPPAPAEAEDEGEVTEQNVQRFGQEFERRWYADRERLGRARHGELERLWYEGRRPRGDAGAREKLERLLAEFPDTNRAGCAALELGHHRLRDRGLSLDERRRLAADAWRLVGERHADALCEYNAPAAGLAKLALANQVLRYTDPAEARRVLQEIIAKHQGETDHLGQPLETTARKLLDLIP